jgi:tetratricopeptide (TPR) repeat protein
VVLVLALAVSCAYYNIFWTAQQEYRTATASTGIADFWDPFTQSKPTGDVLKTIDSCTRRCGKILLLYPKSKWVDDALIMMGNCFVLKGEYANAIRKYEEVLRLYASSQFADEARYMKAYTHVLEGSTAEALVMLDSRTVEQIKSREWQERAVFLAALIYRNQGDCPNAITHLQKYIEKFPNGRKAAEASLALGECLMTVEKPAEAVKVLEPLAKKEGLVGAVASVGLGRAHRELGQPDAALRIFEQLYAKAPVDSLKARAQIEKALTLESQGKFDEAITALTVADSLGKATLGGEAKYQAGLIYEKDIGDFPKAAAAYEEASRNASEFARAASKRAAAVKAVEKYQLALSDSSSQDLASQAMNRFMLAEAYLLDLGLSGRAVEQFRVLSDSLPPNQFTARSMLALASLLDAQGDSSSLTYYNAVIDSFPATVWANVARSRFDLPLVDIEVAPADTARVQESETHPFVGPELPGEEPERPLVGPELPAEMATTPAPGPEQPRHGPPDTRTHPAVEDSILGRHPRGSDASGASIAPVDTVGAHGSDLAPLDTSAFMPDSTGKGADSTVAPDPEWGNR